MDKTGDGSWTRWRCGGLRCCRSPAARPSDTATVAGRYDGCVLTEVRDESPLVRPLMHQLGVEAWAHSCRDKRAYRGIDWLTRYRDRHAIVSFNLATPRVLSVRSRRDRPNPPTVAQMYIEPVDERDSCWENPSPRFRVYRYRQDGFAQTWTTTTDDVIDADVLEVIDWARERAGADQLYAVALVVDDRFEPEGQQRGLVWLLGDELPNSDPADLTDPQQLSLAAMFRRREEYRAALGRG